MNAKFQQTMRRLFAHMAIELPAGRADEAYRVEVDGAIVLKFFAAPATWLNIVADLGGLPPAASSETLQSLLHANTYTPLFPEFQFKVGVSRATSHIELWLRRRLEDLQDDGAIVLFEAAIELSGLVRDGMQRPFGNKRSDHQLARLTRQRDPHPAA